MTATKIKHFFCVWIYLKPIVYHNNENEWKNENEQKKKKEFGIYLIVFSLFFASWTQFDTIIENLFNFSVILTSALKDAFRSVFFLSFEFVV